MDKIFKIGVLVLGILFLILFYQRSYREAKYQSSNREARYVYYKTDHSKENSSTVFDTQTGHVYSQYLIIGPNKWGWSDFDMVKGKVVLGDVEVQAKSEPKKEK